jgi:rSAM/selenodomain-associated transferase 1
VGESLHKKTNNDGILFFIKYPEQGKVKSRLIPKLNTDFILRLYQSFVEDTLHTLKATPFDIIICYHPKEKHAAFKRWLGSSYHYHSQHGNNLGERISDSYTYWFNQGYTNLIVIGSDSPDIPASLLTNAFQQLTTHQAVIGPTRDGGYYLLGFTATGFNPGVFHNIPWSTPKVFTTTMEKLTDITRSIHILPPWRDVDTYDDLKDLYVRNQHTPFHTSQTMTMLQTYFHTLSNTHHTN